MGITLGNLLGLWGLLGIPAVLLIHFIHRRYLKLPVSTLFLLEQLAPKEVEGRQFRWIRNSLQLWLQLLAVLLLTFLLCDPRRLTPSPVQRIVLVVDSSFSMAASKARMLAALPGLLSELARAADRTEWLVYETNLRENRIYRGWKSEEALSQLKTWEPTIGEHDVQGALREIKEGIGSAASYYLFTDHRQPVPEAVTVISYGEAVPNWGLIGVRVADDAPFGFQAVLRNYSNVQAQKKWWIEQAGTKLSEDTVTLEPGHFTTLSAQFPENVDELTIRIEGDAFTLDDALPIRRPQARQMKIYADRGDFSAPFRRMLASIHSAERVNKPEAAELSLLTSTEVEPGAELGNAILFYAAGSGAAKSHSGPVTAEHSSLIDGLTWESLIPGAPGNLVPASGDETILWHEKTPLIFVRKNNGHALLVINFDVREGNALQHPSLIILLHRFIERIRTASSGYLSQNYELSESLPPMTLDPAQTKLHIRPIDGTEQELSGDALLASRSLDRAPLRPAFFDVVSGGTKLLSGAATYADARESDFTGFLSFRENAEGKAAERPGEDSFEVSFPLWMLALIAIVIGTWSNEKLRALRLRRSGGVRTA